MDHVPTPWHLSGGTCGQVKDTGVSLPELLMAADVPLHRSVHEDMWPLPPHQSAAESTHWRIISAPYSGVPLGHHQHQLHSWTSRVSQLWHNHECCILSEQSVSLHSDTHNNHCPWGSLPIPHAHLEAAQTSKTGCFWLRSTVCSRADAKALPPPRHKAGCYYGLLLRGDYQRLTMELLSPMAVMVRETWLQLMCCALPKRLCP